MKMKYYLRGFGAGVIFATLTLMIAFQVNQNIQPVMSQEKGDIKENHTETMDETGDDIKQTSGNTQSVVQENSESKTTEDKLFLETDAVLDTTSATETNIQTEVVTEQVMETNSVPEMTQNIETTIMPETTQQETTTQETTAPPETETQEQTTLPASPSLGEPVVFPE